MATHTKPAFLACREAWGQLYSEDFLDVNFLVQRYHEILEGIFANDPAVQERAANALQYLIAPLVTPSKFQTYESQSSFGIYDDDAYHNSRFGDLLHVQLVDRLEPDVVWAMAEAAFALGVLHATGMLPFVEKDDKKATTLYALSATHSSVSGNLAMAHRHEQGFGVPQSCSLAYQHLKVPFSSLDTAYNYTVVCKRLPPDLEGHQTTETLHLHPNLYLLKRLPSCPLACIFAPGVNHTHAGTWCAVCRAGIC